MLDSVTEVRPDDGADDGSVEHAVETEIARTREQIANLERSFAGIVDAAELTSTDDEHDPEGATIAYERAQVSALLRQAREDLIALEEARERVAGGRPATCAACGSTIPVVRVLALPGVRTCVECAP
jgi:RNA polymerase-binding transcription factor DksA